MLEYRSIRVSLDEINLKYVRMAEWSKVRRLQSISLGKGSNPSSDRVNHFRYNTDIN